MEEKPNVLVIGEEKPTLIVADKGRDVVSTLESAARETREKLITGIKDMQKNSNQSIISPLNFMGMYRQSRKTLTSSYSKMMENRISKRRAANKVAAKARRINRLRAK